MPYFAIGIVTVLGCVIALAWDQYPFTYGRAIGRFIRLRYTVLSLASSIMLVAFKLVAFSRLSDPWKVCLGLLPEIGLLVLVWRSSRRMAQSGRTLATVDIDLFSRKHAVLKISVCLLMILSPLLSRDVGDIMLSVFIFSVIAAIRLSHCKDLVLTDFGFHYGWIGFPWDKLLFYIWDTPRSETHYLLLKLKLPWGVDVAVTKTNTEQREEISRILAEKAPDREGVHQLGARTA